MPTVAAGTPPSTVAVRSPSIVADDGSPSTVTNGSPSPLALRAEPAETAETAETAEPARASISLPDQSPFHSIRIEAAGEQADGSMRGSHTVYTIRCMVRAWFSSTGALPYDPVRPWVDGDGRWHFDRRLQRNRRAVRRGGAARPLELARTSRRQGRLAVHRADVHLEQVVPSADRREARRVRDLQLLWRYVEMMALHIN